MKIARLHLQAGEPIRVILQPLHYHVLDAIRPLDLSPGTQQTGTQQNPALLLRQLAPDNQVQNAGFVLQGNEHRVTFAGTLPGYYQARQVNHFTRWPATDFRG